MIPRNLTRADIVSKGVNYQVSVPSGDWTTYLSGYSQQSYGLFDSDDCWDVSTVSYVLEVQLNYLMAMGGFSPEAVAFFKANGYLDFNGKFYLSHRYYGILSRRGDNGGDPWWMANYIQEYGFIPMSLLTYSVEQANRFQTQAEFDADYFNSSAITPQMEAMGKQAASYIKVSPYRVGEVGTTPDLQDVWAAIRQCPVIYTVPVPQPETLWNQTPVPYQGGTGGQHCVGGYKCGAYNPANPSLSVEIPIGDNYVPQFKQLQAGYFLCEVVAIAITGTVAVVETVPQNALNDSVWSSVFEWFTNMVDVVLGRGQKVAPSQA